MQLTYIFDPLCGWCYGAGPVLERLSAMDGITFDLVPSGLFAGEGARPMDRPFAAFAWQNDQRIERLTGQVFSAAYRTNILGAATGMFDSAPATLGVVAVGMTSPGREMDALRHLQGVRFVEGRDNSKIDVVAEALHAAGFDDAAALVENPDEIAMETYRHRIAGAREKMRAFGLNGVPEIILEDERGSRVLPSEMLYGNFEQLTTLLRAA